MTRSEPARVDLDPTTIDPAGEAVDDADDAEKPERLGREEKEAKGRARAPLESVRPIADLRSEEGQSIADWVRSVGPGQGPVRITVSRREPKKHRGVKCDGLLMTLEELVDDIEDRVKEEQGGGTFLIGIKVPREKGAGWKYLTSRQIELAGDPKVEHLRDLDPSVAAAAATAASAPAATESKIMDRVVTRALDFMEQGQRPATPSGPVHDPNLARMIDGLNSTIRTLQSQLEARDQHINALMAKADKSDPFRDKLLDKMLDGESARIAALRAQYDSELSQLRTVMYDNERRLRDGFDRDIKRLEDAHIREIASLNAAFAQSGSARDMSASTQKMVLDGQIAQLTREIDRLAKENAELRAKKDKSILEVAKELEAVRDALGTDDKEEEKEGTITQVVRVLSESKLAAAAVKKLGVGDDEEKKPPVGRPYRLPDGRVVVTDASGVTMLVPPRRKGRPAPATGTSGPPGSPPAQGQGEAAPPMPQVSPVAAEAAVQFLENAYRNNHDPAQVAESVRTMIPAEVMAVLRDRGVDEFLDQVAKLPGGSPLASQKGRLFARKVGKALVDGAPQ